MTSRSHYLPIPKHLPTSWMSVKRIVPNTDTSRTRRGRKCVAGGAADERKAGEEGGGGGGRRYDEEGREESGEDREPRGSRPQLPLSHRRQRKINYTAKKRRRSFRSFVHEVDHNVFLREPRASSSEEQRSALFSR